MIPQNSGLIFNGWCCIFALKKGFYADIRAVCFYDYSTVLICSEDLTALVLISFYNFFAGEMEGIFKAQTEYGNLWLYLFDELKWAWGFTAVMGDFKDGTLKIGCRIY